MIMQKHLIFIILLLIIFTGCKNKPIDNNIYTIATLKGPSSMGMIQMIDSSYNTQNCNIKINIFNEPMQVRKMMLEGTTDFAILPTTMAAILYNSGINYRLVAIPVWGTLYLIGNDPNNNISNWQDLKGKRIYVMAKSMTPDLLFRYLLMQNGINPDKDVALDYSFPTHINLANAITSGIAQYGIMTEPYVSLIMHNNKSVRTIIDLNSEWNKIQGTPLAETAFLCKDEIIQKHPEIVDKIIKQYAKSTVWVNEHPKEAAQLIAKYEIIQDSSAALKAIPNSNLKVINAKDIRQSINSYLKVFYNIKPETVGGKLPDEKFIY